MMDKCHCGKPLYNGEDPCHGVCKECHELIPPSDNSIPQQWGMCRECFVTTMQEDSGKLIKEFTEYGKKLAERLPYTVSSIKTELTEWFDLLEEFNK